MDNNFWICPECGNTYKNNIKKCPNCKNTIILIDEDDFNAENNNSTIFKEISKSNPEDNINSNKNNYTNNNQNVGSNASNNNYYQSNQYHSQPNNYNNQNTGYHNYNQYHSQPNGYYNQNTTNSFQHERNTTNCPCCNEKNSSHINSCPRCGRHDFYETKVRGGFLTFAIIFIVVFKALEIALILFEAILSLFDTSIIGFVLSNSTLCVFLFLVLYFVISFYIYFKSKIKTKYECKHCGYIFKNF